MWLMLALLALGRFFEFFLRSDSADLALGLETAQWTSLLLLGVADRRRMAHPSRVPATPRRSPSRLPNRQQVTQPVQANRIIEPLNGTFA